MSKGDKGKGHGGPEWEPGGLASVPALPLGHGGPGSSLLSPPSPGAWPELPLQPGLCGGGYVSWAAELHGGMRAAAVGPSKTLAHSILQGCCWLSG